MRFRCKYSIFTVCSDIVQVFTRPQHLKGFSANKKTLLQTRIPFKSRHVPKINISLLAPISFPSEFVANNICVQFFLFTSASLLCFLKMSSQSNFSRWSGTIRGNLNSNLQRDSVKVKVLIVKVPYCVVDG